MKQHILFVCKFNRTRSRFAEAIFKKLDKDKQWMVDSAGLIKDNPSKELLKDLREFSKKHKLNLTKPQYLSKKLLFKQNKIIIVADDVPSLIFNSQKKSGIDIIRWKIKDAWRYKKGTRQENFEKIKEEIEKRIKNFLNKN